jgi:phosphoglycolate phosphatase
MRVLTKVMAALPLQACAKKLGIPLGNIVYVGDHAVDVATARAAAVPVIIAEYGYGGMKLRALGADGAIGCLSELSATLAKITQAIDYVLESPDL